MGLTPHQPPQQPKSPDPTQERDPFLVVAEQLHELFLEYRDNHGYDEEVAWAKACCEYLDAKQLSPEPPQVSEDDFPHDGNHPGGGPVG